MSSTTADPRPGLAQALGFVGRRARDLLRLVPGFLAWVGALWGLFTSILYFSFIASFRDRGRGRLRKQLFPMMSNVGARSLPIVALVALLSGSILVLQTADTLQEFGQLSQVPGLVALSITRELGPLMTAIVMIGRVGASYAAVLGSMTINEEVAALRTMAIHPIGHLVAPRFLSLLVMMPCLVTLSYLLGMLGGCVSALLYGIPPALYAKTTFDFLRLQDLFGGLLKASVFAIIISVVSCHYGLTTSGGSAGLGRNIMVSVVTCLVLVVTADVIVTAFLINYVL